MKSPTALRGHLASFVKIEQYFKKDNRLIKGIMQSFKPTFLCLFFEQAKVPS